MDSTPATLAWLLQQAPVVVVMGLALYVLWKDNKSIRKEASKDRQKHKEELQVLNKEVRDKEVQYLDTLKDVVSVMDDVEKGQEKTQNLIMSIKELVMSFKT